MKKPAEAVTYSERLTGSTPILIKLSSCPTTPVRCYRRIGLPFALALPFGRSIEPSLAVTLIERPMSGAV
ncbi:MAG: hypothetical protein FJX61_15615 [Alphaproteobacteria bacterium]|nr:hypothetical protein [Alphaproteobacteria bacterium]